MIDHNLSFHFCQMSLFPLYDQVVAEMDGTETSLNKNHCTTITRLNQEHLNIIYIIILHHYLKTKILSPKFKKKEEKQGNLNKVDLPYGSRTISNGKGISFRRLSQIPEDVQKIIYRYLMMVSSK